MTALSMIPVSVITNLFWINWKRCQDTNPGLAACIITSYIIIAAAGFIAILKKPAESGHLLMVNNFIGTFNLCIGVTGSVFMYFNNGNSFAFASLLLIPFFIGIIIFERIYFNPDFAVENLLRLPTTAQLSISEHFLTSK